MRALIAFGPWVLVALLAPLTSLHGIERGNRLRVYPIGLVFWTVSLGLFLGAIASTVKL